MRARVLASIAIVLGGCGGGPRAGRTPEIANQQPPAARVERLSSKLTGATITVFPGGLELEVPQDWTGHADGLAETLHLTRAQLDAVRVGAGEWDTEYAELVNATLDFDDCAFAGGSEGWGKDAASFADLQMRLYVVPDGIAAVERRIDDGGAKALATILSPERADDRDRVPAARRKHRGAAPVPPPAHEATPPWRRTVFSYPLSYGDYGGTARVDYRLRSLGGSTVVVVFMYASENGKEMAPILASIRWPGQS